MGAGGILRGRKPKPAAIRQLEGKAILHNEPVAPRGILPPPDHLSDIAKQAWQQAVDLLDSMGLFSQADAVALELFCSSYSDYREAEDNVRKYGKVLKSPKNYMYQSPFVGLKNTAHEQCLRLLAEFGMTPVSRARLGATAAAPSDEFEAFLRAG